MSLGSIRKRNKAIHYADIPQGRPLKLLCHLSLPFLDLSAAFEPHATPGCIPLETSATSAQVLPPAWGKRASHTQ